MPYHSRQLLYRIICLAALLAAGHSLFASDPCPDDARIEEVYSQQDVEELEQLVIHLDSCAGDSELLGTALHLLGRLYRDHLKQPEKAIPILKRALVVREKVLGAEHEETGKTLYNLGAYNREVGNIDVALRYLERADAIFQTVDLRFGQMLAGKEIAEALVAKGEFAGAGERLQYIIDLAKRDEDPLQEANFRLDRSNLLLSLEDLEGARQELQQAEALYLANQSSQDFVPGNLNSCYLNLALVFDKLDDYGQALEYHRKAIRGFQRTGNISGEAKCRANLSLTLIQLGQYSTAEAELRRARELSLRAPVADQASLLAQVSDNLGDLYLARGRTEEALQAYQVAILQLVPGWAPELITEAPSAEAMSRTSLPEHLLNHLRDKSNCLEIIFRESSDTTYLNAALSHYVSLSELIDIMRYQQRVQASKLFWREEVSPIYESAVALCHTAGDPARAYYFMERSKSMLLLDAVQENRVRLSFSEQDSRREQQLRKGLEKLRIDLLRMEEAERPALIEQLLAAQKEYDRFRDSLEQKYPELARIQRNRQQLQPDELRQRLSGDNWLFVEYMVGAEHLYVWSMGPTGGFRLRAVPADTLNQAFDNYMEGLAIGKGKRFVPNEYARVAYILHRLLLAPELSNAPTASRLLIIPDGPLAYLPFDALMKKPEWEPEQYLLRDYLIRYAYSGEVLIRQQEHSSEYHTVLTLAPIFEHRERGLAELPEGRNLQDLIPCCMDIYLEEEATSARFLLEAGHASVINLYTHARAGEDGMPMVEFIDTSLLLPEIYTLQIPADMVILAACETGIGDYRQGEGVMSLSRGFTYAGASSLMATLWTVRSNTTSSIVGNVFSGMEQGMTRAEALWEAKKQLVFGEMGFATDRANPYYWAGMVFYGADSTLELPPPCYWWKWYALGGAFLIIVVWIGWYRRKEESDEVPL